MIQSLRFFMEQEQANCDPGHGPALLTLSSQSFMPGFSSVRGNYIESSSRVGLDFPNTRAKAEMISIDWESPIIGSAEFPSVRQGSPARNWLSMGNGFDRTADPEFKAGNGEECAQNSPASFQPELSMNLSMGSRPSNQESEPRTGSQQSAESAISDTPNPYGASPHSMGRYDDQVPAHDSPASCADSTEIDRVPDQKLWTPLKKMARKNNMTSVVPCKNSMEEANNSGHIVGSRNGAAARTCVDCYTTKTPLWRTGPRGPKSLCNACGIRYRKTRRAALSECIDGNAAGSPKRKTEESLIHFKKRSRLSMASCKKNIGLENQSAFAREEEEAAVLLMAMSCGLVHG